MKPAGASGAPAAGGPQISQAEKTRKALDAKYKAEQAAEKKKQLQEELSEEAAKKEREAEKHARAKELAVVEE